MKRLIRRSSVAYLFIPAASRAPSCEWHRNNEVIYFSFTYNECRTQSTKDKNTYITLSQRYCFLSLCFHFVCPSRCPVVTMLTPRASRAHISRDGRRPARCPCRRIHLSFARYSELLVENREIFIPHLFLAPPQGQGWPRLSIAKMLDTYKTRMMGLPCGEETRLLQYVEPFPQFTGTWTTDGQTELLYQYRASLCWRAIKIFDEK